MIVLTLYDSINIIMIYIIMCVYVWGGGEGCGYGCVNVFELIIPL